MIPNKPNAAKPGMLLSFHAERYRLGLADRGQKWIAPHPETEET